MKIFQYFLVLCASSGLVYPSLTDSAATTVPSNAAKQAAATKIQALARGHQARKQQSQLKEMEQAAATKIQAVVRGHQVRNQQQQLKQEAAAQVIQKAGLGFFDRKFLKLESTLNNMPYLQFRDLICSGDYINKTDWLYRYIEIRENKQMFTRGKDGKIDLGKVETVKAEIDFDTLFHKYISLFHNFCYQIFTKRAVNEILY